MSELKWPRFKVEVPGRGLMQCEAMSPFESIELNDATAGMADATAGWCRIGALIGLSWDGAPDADRGDTLANYGRNVVEALHKAGWRQSEMATFARLISEAVLKGETEEAEQRADFSEAQEGAAG